jgi:hypothetical protein
MGLNLAFQPGEDFFVDDECFVVTSVTSPTSFVVRRERDGAEFELSDKGKGHEIAPSVIARSGLRGHGNLARIDITAPQSIKIARGKNYRAARQISG